ncbi:hypothetical protein [Mangrovihabitans endophyticus]|uniref:Membrane protein YesL n=1 Tax=Mangrovihabitans endophyticus TaxID=1751298 RepID=A0A8J3FM86_9ACTN|nr:hypothetical protein [Mangrovihabitans endophyticus]GGK77460.1 hypothetical protein GCM10012284_09350 [Mangrovihabitans endophyticus]
MTPRWHDTVRTATELAVLGFLLVLAALPVVTAPAVTVAGSAAVRHRLDHDRWPSPRACGDAFRRAFWPALAAAVVTVAVAGLIVADLRALGDGRVPGGVPLIAVTAAVAFALLGVGGLAVVTAANGGPVRRAVATAVRAARMRPSAPAACAGVILLAAGLAVLVHPVLVPVLAGYTLFALHVICRRRRHHGSLTSARP